MFVYMSIKNVYDRIICSSSYIFHVNYIGLKGVCVCARVRAGATKDALYSYIDEFLQLLSCP